MRNAAGPGGTIGDEQLRASAGWGMIVGASLIAGAAIAVGNRIDAWLRGGISAQLRPLLGDT